MKLVNVEISVKARKIGSVEHNLSNKSEIKKMLLWRSMHSSFIILPTLASLEHTSENTECIVFSLIICFHTKDSPTLTSYYV